MDENHDVIIIGGAVIGAAVACYLTADPGFDGSVLMIERDPIFATASSTLSASSIRQQFSHPLNVRISQYGLEVIRDFAALMAIPGDGPQAGPGPDLHFHPGGYLFLAETEAEAAALRARHALQTGLGADVALLTPAALAEAFPHLDVSELVLAAYGQSGEGWFDSVGLMTGFRRKARAQGAGFRQGTVTSIARDGNRVTGVTLDCGTRLSAGTIVNAAGARAAQIAAMAGLTIPVEPRKRTQVIFDCARSPEGTARVNGGRLPLMVEPGGVFCRPDGRYFLAGCTPADDPAVDPDDLTPRYEEFEEIIWPALARRSPAFEAIKPISHWAGHYAYNPIDHNMIVGPHPEIDNLIFANGFSGHGLQQAPATGRAVAEWILHGGFRSLDLSAFSLARLLNGQPIREQNVI